MMLTVAQCANWLDENHENVARWCRLGVINGMQEDTHARWYISPIAFANFLYQNPRLLEHYRKKTFYGFGKMIQQQTLDILDHRPEVMTIYDVAKLFDLTPQAIRHWVSKGKIQPFAKTTNQTPVFTVNAVKELVRSDPRLEHKLRNFYTLYNRREVKRYLS